MCSVNKMKTMEKNRETDTAAIKSHQVSSLYRKGMRCIKYMNSGNIVKLPRECKINAHL